LKSFDKLALNSATKQVTFFNKTKTKQKRFYC
jgi:hypothetical protein